MSQTRIGVVGVGVMGSAIADASFRPGTSSPCAIATRRRPRRWRPEARMSRPARKP